jgi:hypothetical protein
MLPKFTTHPGRITVVAPDGTETVQTADTLPDWLKFARGSDGHLVPVVLITRARSRTGCIFRSYGPDGRLVAITASPGTTPVAPPETTSGCF